MFDLGWTEMMLIGIVALIVVGPKELPTLFRAVGQAVGKARGMAREFTRAMEAAADETGVREIDRQIRAATRPVQFATDRLKEGAGLKSAPRPAIQAAGTPLAPVPPVAPLDPGEPLPEPQNTPLPAALAVKPGGATEALIEARAAERAALAEASLRRTQGVPATPDEAS